ncbi:hypothetical protein SLA2020_381150 [Shorea laevis]
MILRTTASQLTHTTPASLDAPYHLCLPIRPQRPSDHHLHIPRQPKSPNLFKQRLAIKALEPTLEDFTNTFEPPARYRASMVASNQITLTLPRDTKRFMLLS